MVLFFLWFLAYHDVIQIKSFDVDYFNEKLGCANFDIDSSYPFNLVTNVITSMELLISLYILLNKDDY